MTERTDSLLPFYQGWDVYQQRLLTALGSLSAEQLTLRAAPHLRSIGENAAHIVGTRAGWMYYTLGQGDTAMVELAQSIQASQPGHSVTGLLKGLETSWRVIQETLASWTPVDLTVLVTDTEDDGTVQTYTRQWVLWHLIEHDMHHGGELSFTLGMHGLNGIDI